MQWCCVGSYHRLHAGFFEPRKQEPKLMKLEEILIRFKVRSALQQIKVFIKLDAVIWLSSLLEKKPGMIALLTNEAYMYYKELNLFILQ